MAANSQAAMAHCCPYFHHGLCPPKGEKKLGGGRDNQGQQ